MSGGIHQTVSPATFLKSIQYHLCVGCHPWQPRGHLSLKQILLENKGHREPGVGGAGGGVEDGRIERAGHYFLFISPHPASV